MGFPVLKPGETFSIGNKLIITKKIFAQGLFFDLLKTIITKKADFFMQVSH